MGASGGGAGGGGGKSGAGASAGSGLGASATTGAAAAPAASSGLGSATNTPVSAIPSAGGVQSGQSPVSGIARPGAQEIVNQISPTTTPESSQAVVPTARDVAQSTQKANVGNNPAQGALDFAVKQYTGGLIGAGAGNNEQSALPALGQMTGASGQSVAIPQSAPGITNVQPVGAVGTSPKGPGRLSRAGSSILENLGITPENRQQLFQDAIVQLAQQGKNNTTQSELPRTQSLQEILAALGIKTMQEGGELKPGQTAVVGEAGPEVARGQAGGGATITPLKQLAQFPPDQAPGVGQRIVEGLQDALIFAAGLQNPAMFVNARAAAAAQEAKLAELGLKNPTLLETSPSVARAATRQVGQAGAEAVLRAPDAAERERFAGLGLLPPATQPQQGFGPGEREQAIQSARQQGIGITATPRGTNLEIPAVQRKDMDTAKSYATFHSLVADQGLPPVAAAQKLIEAGRLTGTLIPEPLLKLSTADTDREVAALLAEAEADARNRSEERAAAGIAFERTTGERQGRQALPLSKEEIAAAKAANVRQAREEVNAAIQTGQVPREGTDIGASVRTRVAQLNAPLEQQEFYASKLGGPVEPTPESARLRIAQIDQGQRALDRLLKVANPDYIGFTAGRYGSIKEFFGKTGKSEAALRSEIRALRRAYRLAQTGQQASDAELQRLYGELINEKMGVTQFAESLKVIGREIEDKYGSEANILLANNERAPQLFKSERIDKLLGNVQAQPPAAPPTPRTSRTPGQPAPKGRVTQQQASREVGATLDRLRAELSAAVKSGELTGERAAAIYNRAEAAGLPAQ